jgi:hypothetical protein
VLRDCHFALSGTIIAITAAHYIHRPRQATSGLGALLNDKKIIQLKERLAG